jgi:hypothetical protein
MCACADDLLYTYFTFAHREGAPFEITEHVRMRRRSSLTLFYMCAQAGAAFESTDHVRMRRRVQELEEDLETATTKCQISILKLDKAATTADDSDRMAKVLQNRYYHTTVV